MSALDYGETYRFLDWETPKFMIFADYRSDKELAFLHIGDVNIDGEINAYDLEMISKIILKIP